MCSLWGSFGDPPEMFAFHTIPCFPYRHQKENGGDGWLVRNDGGVFNMNRLIKP